VRDLHSRGAAVTVLQKRAQQFGLRKRGGAKPDQLFMRLILSGATASGHPQILTKSWFNGSSPIVAFDTEYIGHKKVPRSLLRGTARHYQ
jgi:hypothetical protein